jgi:predicted metal-dependent enzyme (double-stranded beta helix superfamily)
MEQRLRAISQFLAETSAALCECGISKESLAEVAENLKQLAAEPGFPYTDFPVAKPGKEVVYELGRDSCSGIALYLVSDSPGTKSPPHEHQTWAVIVGIDGIELNKLYNVIDPQRRQVKEVNEVAVAKKEAILLLEDEIHSTEAVGPIATYHLHLYGQSLNALPKLDERTYICMDTA